ncbi:MAG TPA: glycosyltransferase family 2 protein [Brumimicrobium sp.]|nr:glycosyltransferase family 2 protein [Brumimicrobium sp.]
MKTAVVILNWNGLSFLKQFLPTLIEFTADATIVVVDNQSSDESLSFLRDNHPEVEVILNESNGGFAKGYNDGLNQLKGRFEYYVLINSDIEVTQNWLVPLIEKLNTNPAIAGVQPKVLAFHKKTHFEHAGGSGGFIDKNFYPFCRGRIFDEVEEDLGQYDNDKEVFWTTGACMAVRSDVYHQLNGLDEDFFAHMEEIDFCWRAKKMNHSFYVVPASKVYHVGGGTLNYESPRKTYLNFRNSLYTIHKNYDGWLFGKVFYRLILDGVAAGKYLVGFDFKHIFAIVKAHNTYFRNIPTLRKKRKNIQQESTQFNKAGLYKASLLWAYFFKRITKFEGLNKRFFS